MLRSQAIRLSQRIPLKPSHPFLLGFTALRPLQVRRNIMSDAPYKTVTTDKAPSAIGPYSQAVVHNGMVFASGSIPFVPSTMQIVEGGIEEQAQQALDNMLAVVTASGSDKSHVLKTTVFLKDMNQFAQVNAVYERFFSPYKPARSAVEVARLPKDVGIEVECIAALKS